MQLDTPSPPEAEDQWLAHWVTTAFQSHQTYLQAPKPAKIGLAVSGGGDSMAMLHLFARHAEAAGYVLSAATVDHGLRPEAQTEAEQVHSACQRLGIPHATLRWDKWDGTGNLQAEARTARYALLAEWAKENELAMVLLGHTEDDVAETFLIRLARGSGLDGLAAMEKSISRNGVEFVRPLLGVDRETLRRYLRRNNIDWIEDPSNEDRQFQRVRARDALRSLEPLGIDRAKIVSAAYDLNMAKGALRDTLFAHAKTAVSFIDGDILLDERPAPLEIRRRLLAAALQWQGMTDYPPRASTWPELDAAIRECRPLTLNGCIVIADKESVRISREYNSIKGLRCAAKELWDHRWRLEGPERNGLEIAALGEFGLSQCTDWRKASRPRQAVLASPAVWAGDELIAAPLAGLENGWCAQLTRSREQFLSWLLSH